MFFRMVPMLPLTPTTEDFGTYTEVLLEPFWHLFLTFLQGWLQGCLQASKVQQKIRNSNKCVCLFVAQRMVPTRARTLQTALSVPFVAHFCSQKSPQRTVPYMGCSYSCRRNTSHVWSSPSLPQAVIRIVVQAPQGSTRPN